MIPLSTSVADDEQHRTHQPVDGHRDPDTQNAHAKSDTKDIAEANTAYPHGNDRQDHAVFYIPCGTEGICQCERFRPEEHTADAVIPDDLLRKADRKSVV